MMNQTSRYRSPHCRMLLLLCHTQRRSGCAYDAAETSRCSNSGCRWVIVHTHLWILHPRASSALMPAHAQHTTAQCESAQVSANRSGIGQ